MAELRHSASMSNRASAGASPAKVEDASHSFISAAATDVGGRDQDRDHDKDPHRPSFVSALLNLPVPIRSLLALEDPRASTSYSYRILVGFLAFLVLVGLLSLPSFWSRLVRSSSLALLLDALAWFVSCYFNWRFCSSKLGMITVLSILSERIMLFFLFLSLSLSAQLMHFILVTLSRSVSVLVLKLSWISISCLIDFC